MLSLKPKQGGTAAPPPPQGNNVFLKVALVLCLLLIAGVGYSSYSTRLALEARIAMLQDELSTHEDSLKSVRAKASDMASDIDVVSKRIGVTAQELDKSRKFAEKLQLAQEQAKEELANQIATKAESLST